MVRLLSEVSIQKLCEQAIRFLHITYREKLSIKKLIHILKQ
jgi:hypothetical protein